MTQQTASLTLFQACALALALSPAAWAQGFEPNMLPKPKPPSAPAGPSKAETQAEARARQAEEKARKAQEEEAAAKARIDRAEARAKAAEEKLRAAEAKAAAKQEPATVSVREVQPVITAVPSFGPVITAVPSSPLTTWDQWLGMVELPINPIGQGSGITLGQANGGDSDEKPTYRVQVPYRLAMMSAEATFAQWDECVKEGGCRHKPSDTRGRGQQPAMRVSWDDIAKEFLPWLNAKAGLQGSPNAYRLPTEAEWEYAARAGSDGPFSLGANNQTPLSAQSANYDANYSYGGSPKGEYRQKTLPVKSFAPNAWGLHDMHGNVWEWVQDCYVEKEYAKRTGSTAWDARKTSAESSNCSRVVRGGSWSGNPYSLRSAYRYRDSPELRVDVIGFRLARMLP
jgi:formylglycine-generating enzyme required for sulfatase activity